VIVFVFDQKLLIDLSGFLKMGSQVVESSHAKLVLKRVAESAMIAHDLVLISALLS
jgi:hypothetical protein